MLVAYRTTAPTGIPPSRPASEPPGRKTKEPFTTYVQALVGPKAAMDTRLDPTSRYGAWGTSIPRDFPDGTSNTIGIVEAFEPVPGRKPADLVYDEQKPLPRLGGHLRHAARVNHPRRRRGD